MQCGYCDGEVLFLGRLGTVDNFRCRACGIVTQIVSENPWEDDDLPDDATLDEAVLKAAFQVEVKKGN